MDICDIVEKDGSHSLFITVDNFLSKEEIDFYKHCIESVNDWKTGDLWGKPIKRSQKWYHDDNKYFSSNWTNQEYARWKSHVMENWISCLRTKVQDFVNHIFPLHVTNIFDNCKHPNINSVLLNHYANGESSIKYHRDDESIFGDNPTIAMLTFGIERPLNFIRSTFDPQNPKCTSIDKNCENLNKTFVIKEGQLFIMAGSVQKYFVHGIDKDMSVINSRFSVTFREHVL